MFLFGKSLNAVSAVGAGDSIDAHVPVSKHSIQVVLTGAPDTAVVTLEGTLDRVNWFVLATWTKASQTSGDIVSTADKPCVATRANCTTLTGGTSPTVSAWIGSC